MEMWPRGDTEEGNVKFAGQEFLGENGIPWDPNDEKQ